MSVRHVDSDKTYKNTAGASTKDTQGADGAADLLQALSQSALLEELAFAGCSQIPAAAWQKVRDAKWLDLKKAYFGGCLAERNG